MSVQSDFIKTIAPLIQKYCSIYGYKYPSAILAQACCESNYGQSKLSAQYHNYFGMKCGSSWTGASVNMATKEEYQPGTLTSIRDNFRSYSSMEEGVKGYFEFISKPRYNNLKDAVSSTDYIEKIKADGYATSSTYVNTLVKLIAQWHLEDYDSTIVKRPVDAQVVRDVIELKYGTGEDRKQKLHLVGYDYTEVQTVVNRMYVVAKEVKDLLKDENRELYDVIFNIVKGM